MKTSYLKLLLAVLFLSQSKMAEAQTDSAHIKQRAFYFVDSLQKEYGLENWDHYVALTYPGVIKYFGSKEGFLENVAMQRLYLGDSILETVESLEVKQIVETEKSWQCVVEKIKGWNINGRKAKLLTYIVGRSADGGNTWTFFEISEGMLTNARQVMRDISNDLLIPERRIVYEDQVEKAKKKASSKRVARR